MNLPEGWYEADCEKASHLEKELHLEIIPGHKLYGKNIKIIGHRDGATDDVLCKHVGEQDLYTVVHLTWSMKPEINSDYPFVEFHGGYEEFIKFEKNWEI